jgi:hypothetical protein
MAKTPSNKGGSKGGSKRPGSKPRSARQAMFEAKQVQRTMNRRVSDLGAPTRASGNALRAAAEAGARPDFAAGTSKAYQNSVMRQIREAKAAGKKINANEVHRKAVADHARVYAGAAAGNADRRTGIDRRKS